jgi:hypothetical protein
MRVRGFIILLAAVAVPPAPAAAYLQNQPATLQRLPSGADVPARELQLAQLRLNKAQLKALRRLLDARGSSYHALTKKIREGDSRLGKTESNLNAAQREAIRRLVDEQKSSDEALRKRIQEGNSRLSKRISNKKEPKSSNAWGKK